MSSFGDGRTPRLAGLTAWLAAGVPIALMLAGAHAPRPARAAVIVAAYLVFGAAFLLMTRRGESSRVPPVVLLAVQSLCALAMTAALRSGFEGIFLVIVAAQLAFALPIPRAIAWAAAQAAAFGALQLGTAPLLSIAVQTAAYGGFAAFALYAGWIADREARQRSELALLYAELASTQALLAESTRLAERTRIARDLHDVLGHHLTALSLSLEVAAHVAEGRAKEEVERARSLSKLLLADVRGVVSQFREGEALELGSSLRALASGLRRPEVELSIAPDLGVTEPALAEALLRCAQELMTNAARHSDARSLALSLDRRDGRITMRARDDGRGAACFQEGNGLAGMRERVRELGGSMRVESGAGRGFEVSIEVPA